MGFGESEGVCWPDCTLVAFLRGRSCWFVLRDCSSPLIRVPLEDKAGHAPRCSGRPRRVCMHSKNKKKRSRATTGGLTAGFLFFFCKEILVLPHTWLGLGGVRWPPRHICSARSTCFHIILRTNLENRLHFVSLIFVFCFF